MLGALAIAGLLLSFPVDVRADDETNAPDAESSGNAEQVETRIGAQENLDEAAEAEPHSPAPAFNEPEARRAFDAGVLMLATILIAGVGLMALILLWGSRARRIARQPLPTVAPRDELWYLKNKKESATATGDDPPTADEASE